MSQDIKDEFDLDTDITYEQILNSLLDSKDLVLKTEVKEPQKLAGLKIFGKYLEQIGFEEGSSLIEMFIEILNEFMVSYDRQSRREIVDAVKSMFEKKSVSMSLSEKLTTNMAR
jgi:hypothetical protein